MQVGGEKGYSLLEVLVAVAIMAMAAVPLSQSMSMGLSTWEKLHSRAEKKEHILRVRHQLSLWLTNTRAVDSRRNGSDIQYPFVGAATSMSFLTSMNPDPRADRLQQAWLSVSDDNALMVSFAVDPAGSDATERTERILLTGVTNVNFKYFDELKGWESRWEDKLELPKGIKIGLELDDERLNWPELIVSTQIDDWAFCFFESGVGCVSGQDAG